MSASDEEGPAGSSHRAVSPVRSLLLPAMGGHQVSRHTGHWDRHTRCCLGLCFCPHHADCSPSSVQTPGTSAREGSEAESLFPWAQGFSSAAWESLRQVVDTAAGWQGGPERTCCGLSVCRRHVSGHLHAAPRGQRRARAAPDGAHPCFRGQRQDVHALAEGCVASARELASLSAGLAPRLQEGSCSVVRGELSAEPLTQSRLTSKATTARRLVCQEPAIATAIPYTLQPFLKVPLAWQELKTRHRKKTKQNKTKETNPQVSRTFYVTAWCKC